MGEMLYVWWTAASHLPACLATLLVYPRLPLALPDAAEYEDICEAAEQSRRFTQRQAWGNLFKRQYRCGRTAGRAGSAVQ